MTTDAAGRAYVLPYPAEDCPDNESATLRLYVDHVTYNIGTLDSLDYNLRNCLPSHRDALLDARQRYYPDAPTEGWG